MALLGPRGVSIAPHTPFIGPAGLATLHFLATMKEPAYYAVIEAQPHMDMYGDSGLTRWQPELDVPTGPGLGFDPDPAFLEKYRPEPLRLDLAAQHRLVDAQDRGAVVGPQAHALGQALQVVRRGALLQRHAELVAELEREMQVLVGEVEGEGGRRVVARQRAQR